MYHKLIISLKYDNLKTALRVGFEPQTKWQAEMVALRRVVPNHCSRDHKCSLSSLELPPEKINILNILYSKSDIFFSMIVLSGSP